MSRIKTLCVLSIFLSTSSSIWASHISGGDVAVKHLEGNTFEVTLQLFRDCINANPNAPLPENLTVFFYQSDTDNITDSLFMELGQVNFPELGDACYVPEICIEIGIYVDTLELDDHAAGYYLSWERCCRVAQTTNLFDAGSEGMVFTASIADPALMNSSPKFAPYPSDGYFCVSYANQFSFTAEDIDGDSLVYSLSTPIKGSLANGGFPDPLGGGPMPFTDIPWDTGFSLANICGGSPAMSINSETGLINASPALQGFYAYGVVVEEYRDGVKIGEVRREITMEATLCEFDVAPDFVGYEVTDTVFIQPFVANTIPVYIEDNETDSIEQTVLYFESEIFSGDFEILAEYELLYSVPGSLAGNIIWDSLTCDYVRDEPYWAYFLTQSENLCTGEISYDTLNLAIVVQLPPNVNTIFTSPTMDYNIIFGQEDTYEFDVTAVDGNVYDTLSLSMLTLPNIGANPITFSPDSALLEVDSPFSWIVTCEDIREEPYIIDFRTITSRCFTQDTTYLPVSLTVSMPDDFPTILESPNWNNDIYTVYQDSSYCFNVKATDENNIDTLFITADYSSDVFTVAHPATFADSTGLFEVTSRFCWTPLCEHVRSEIYHIDFTITAKNCDIIQVIEQPMDIFVTTPSLGVMDTIPNVFSPNEDAFNETWRIAHKPDYCITDKYVHIFNRWGDPVLETFDLSTEWDGLFNGEPASEGEYYYTIQYKYLQEPRNYKGVITLMR